MGLSGRPWRPLPCAHRMIGLTPSNQRCPPGHCSAWEADTGDILQAASPWSLSSEGLPVSRETRHAAYSVYGPMLPGLQKRRDGQIFCRCFVLLFGCGLLFGGGKVGIISLAFPELKTLSSVTLDTILFLYLRDAGRGTGKHCLN